MNVRRLVAALPALFALGTVSLAAPAAAATRRALVVGIDDYGAGKPAKADAPRTWVNLDGAVADARAMEAALVSSLGFEAGQITVLTNGEATRARLLVELNELAAAARGPADVVLFYFAGHGSQVPNSKSKELDQLDETLVPADSRDGALDLSDKEIGAILEQAARRGAKVTVLLDSCHSGSATRGVSVQKLRRIEPDRRTDRADARVPKLAEAGGLTLSAAQDYQPAAEVTDEHGAAHGAFTSSLLRALAAQPPSATAEALFLAAREDMRARGFLQEPVLEGPAIRRSLPLLGEKHRGATGKPLAAVARVDVARREVTLRAGTIGGIGPGSVFAKAGALAGARPRLVVTSSEFASASATPERQTDSLDGIDRTTVFELVIASPPREAALRVAVPDAPISADRVHAVARSLSPLRSDPAIVWVDDPGAIVPTHTVLHDGTEWVLVGPTGASVRLGERPSVDQVRRAALGSARAEVPRAAPCDSKPCIAVRLPPPRELVAAFGFGRRPEDALQRVALDAAADYVVYGRPSRGGSEWALVRLVSASTRCRAADGVEIALPLGVRNAREQCEVAKGRWVQENTPAPEALPPRSDFFPLGADARVTADALEAVATRVARVSGLLKLRSPGGRNLWPYDLAVRRVGAKAFSEGMLRAGSHELVLRATGEVAQAARRRVYVLAVQGDGAIQLLYPQANVENLFPPAMAPPATEYVLDVPIEVAPPYGVDTLLLLSSQEPIVGLEALQAEAILTEPPERIAARGGVRAAAPHVSSPLSELLVDAAARTRSFRPAPVADWSIQQIKFVTGE